jgi:hypothetical protein
VKRVALLGRSLRLSHAELVRPGVDSTPVHYLGEGESLRYLAHLHGGEMTQVRENDLPLVGLRRLIRRHTRQSLVYVELNRLLAPLMPGDPAITLPWITQMVTLAGDGARTTSGAFEGVYGRKVRKHGLTYRRVTAPDLVEEFFHELYIPYIESRFGDAAHLRTERELQTAVRSGFLLQVVDADGWLSGVVCRLRRHQVTALAYGLREPHPELLDKGALSAASYFLIRWAREHGLERVNLLRSRPHRKDGVFEHKRRLGADAIWDPWPHTVIGVYTPDHAPLPPPARGILVRHRARQAVPLEDLADMSRASLVT